MHIEGIAFYMSNGRPGYVPIIFTDESPGAVRGVPIAIARGESVVDGHEALAQAVLSAHASQGEGKVGVYVGPHTTDLEVTFLWIAGFRARKVRPCEVVAARSRWQITAWRHYAEVVGLAKRLLRVKWGPGHVTRQGSGLRAGTAVGGRGRRRPRRGEDSAAQRQDAAQRSVQQRPGVA